MMKKTPMMGKSAPSIGGDQKPKMPMHKQAIKAIIPEHCSGMSCDDPTMPAPNSDK